MLQLVKNSINKYRKKKLYDRVKLYGKDVIEDVYRYCITAQELRNGHNCALYYSNKNYTERMCEEVIEWLFDMRKMGAYCLCEGDPQELMKEWILNNYSEITNDSAILEVGPGNLPLFKEAEYPNWYGIDNNYHNGLIDFSGNQWGKGMYHRVINGSWERIAEAKEKIAIDRAFDLVCGSHSFEHNQMPVKSLKGAAQILRENGLLIMFVPDGFSTWSGNYDKTHTMYLTNSMVEDLFAATECYKDVKCRMFRNNMDLVISARKR